MQSKTGLVQCKQKHGCDSARQYTSPRISQVHGFHRSTNFTVPPVHESTTFTSPRVFKFVRVIELLSYLRRLYVLPEVLELPHVCSFLRSDVERRILPVETWLGYAHPGLRRRTSRAWWNSESCTLGDRYVLRCRALLRCKASAGLTQCITDLQQHKESAEYPDAVAESERRSSGRLPGGRYLSKG